MGYSITHEQSKTLQRIESKCLKLTDSQNTWKEVGWPARQYFWELDPVELADGALLGKWFLMSDVGGTCRFCGSVRIENDGKVTRGPAWLRMAAVS